MCDVYIVHDRALSARSFFRIWNSLIIITVIVSQVPRYLTYEDAEAIYAEVLADRSSRR